jgi:hypothetical protein
MHATVYSASAFKKGLAISCIPSVGITMDTTLQRELCAKKAAAAAAALQQHLPLHTTRPKCRVLSVRMVGSAGSLTLVTHFTLLL